MNPTHTPTPWKIGGWGAIDNGKSAGTVGPELDGDPGYRIIAKMENWREHQADAAFIVRAVNAHDEMLAELKNCLRLMERDQTVSPAYDRIRQVIAKAEGK